MPSDIKLFNCPQEEKGHRNDIIAPRTKNIYLSISIQVSKTAVFSKV